MFKSIAFICLLVGIGLSCNAQKKEQKADSTSVVSDSSLIDPRRPVDTIKSYASKYDPRRALLLAAVLPGAGQIYNKKYWKLPLVWGGLGLLVNAVSYYENAYVKYKNELFITINGGIPPSKASEATLRSVVDDARRQRDFFLVISGLVYILQMVDAHVDAHLKEFDLNPKLRVSIKPQFQQSLMSGRSSGVAVILKF